MAKTNMHSCRFRSSDFKKISANHRIKKREASPHPIILIRAVDVALHSHTGDAGILNQNGRRGAVKHIALDEYISGGAMQKDQALFCQKILPSITALVQLLMVKSV